MEDQEIIIRLDMMLAREKMTLTELSQKIKAPFNGMSALKNGRGKAIKYKTLMRICIALNCTPNDIFEFRPYPPGTVISMEDEEEEEF